MSITSVHCPADRSNLLTFTPSQPLLQRSGNSESFTKRNPFCLSRGMASFRPAAVWLRGWFMCRMTIAPGSALSRASRTLLLRARRPRIAQDVVVDHLVTELACHLHGHFVAVRRAGPVELRLAARDGLDLPAVFLDLVDQLRHACRPLDAVSLVSVHGAGLVGKAVVFDLEEGVCGQLLEGGRVGVDPASADKEGGGDLFLPQSFDEHRIDPAAPRAAAGIEGQRDDFLGRVELCFDAGHPLAPILRGLVFVGGDDLLLPGLLRALRSRRCRGFRSGRSGCRRRTPLRGDGSSCG